MAFAPGTSTAVRTATLNIAHDAAGSPTSVSLTGQGQVAPAVQVPTTLAFGLRAIGSTTNLPLTVTNNGTAPLVVTGVTLNPAVGSGFTVPTNGCTTVAPGGHLHHHGSLCPRQRDHRPHGNAEHRAQRCRFTRHGCPERSGAGAPPVMVTPATVAFGTRVVGTTRTVNIRVSNNGPGNLVFAANPLSLPAGPFTATMGNCPDARSPQAGPATCR